MIADALSTKQPNKEILLQAVRNGHIEEYTMVINIYLMNSLYYRFQMNNMEWIFDGIDFKW